MYRWLLCVALFSAGVLCMMRDDSCHEMVGGKLVPVVDNIHCDQGFNVLHDRVCKAGKCVDRARAQSMRWRYGGNLEYIVCNQLSLSEHVVYGGLVEATITCARNVSVSASGMAVSGAKDAIFKRRFDLGDLTHLACFTAPLEAMHLEPISSAGEDELVVCESHVIARKHPTQEREIIDTYRFGFSYNHATYSRYY